MLYFTEKKYVSPTGKALKDIGVLAALKINGVRVNSYTGDLERVQAPTVLGKRTRAEFYEGLMKEKDGDGDIPMADATGDTDAEAARGM